MTGVEIGEYLRLCRDMSGLSQTELARRIHKDQPTVSRIEKGEITADVATAINWAKATGSGEMMAMLLIGTASAKRAMSIQHFYFQTKTSFEMLERSI